MTFREFSLCDAVQERLENLGFIDPTPIQSLALEPVLEGRDVMGKAETGTGKTLAFSLPVIERVNPEEGIQALVLAPTRELARQVADTVEQVGEARGLKVATLVGGESQADQLFTLKRGCHIAVGTPGRVLDFARMGSLPLRHIKIAVLDEADRMLDMGFIDQIVAILNMTPEDRQTLLFSATFEPELRRIAKRYMREPLELNTSKGLTTVPKIAQKFVKVLKTDKLPLLRLLLDVSNGQQTIVFANTKRDVSWLGKDLWARGYPSSILHGDYGQDVRDKVIAGFRKGDFHILAATDVAQRGLDIPEVRHVINFTVPGQTEDYIHRIGRTGRAGRAGTVLSLVDETEWHDFRGIQKVMGDKLEELSVPPGIRTWTEPARGGRSGGFGAGRGAGRGRGTGRPGRGPKRGSPKRGKTGGARKAGAPRSRGR